MKNKYITILSAAALLAFTGCDDFLDKLPDSRMELNDVETISNLLVSAYAEVNPAYLFEMESDNADLCENTGWTEASRFQRQAWEWADISETADPETPQELWNGYYSAIAASNAAIEYIDGLDESEASQYEAQLGEALICRAYNMFCLTNIFCMAYDPSTAQTALGLPYPEKPETEVGQKYDRGTLAEVYEKIDNDIQRGLPLVKNEYTRPKFHFNPSAAKAFATRFYLYYQKYDKAVSYATEVLGDNPAASLRNWKALYNSDPNRMVMPEVFIKADQTCNLLLQVVQSEWGAIGGNYIYGDRYAHGQAIARTETLQASYPWGKSQLYAYVWYNNSLSKVIFRKVPYEFEYTDIQAGIGYAHSEYAVFTTDVALIERAEAYALNGQYDLALADLNTLLSVFHRSGAQLTLDQIKTFYAGEEYYTPTEATPKKAFNTSFEIEPETQEPLLQAIIQLKRVLTLHEGMRWNDIKRYGIEIYRRTMNSNYDITGTSDTLKPDDPRRAIQLPQDVIYGGLEANPRR